MVIRTGIGNLNDTPWYTFSSGKPILLPSKNSGLGESVLLLLQLLGFWGGGKHLRDDSSSNSVKRLIHKLMGLYCGLHGWYPWSIYNVMTLIIMRGHKSSAIWRRLLSLAVDSWFFGTYRLGSGQIIHALQYMFQVKCYKYTCIRLKIHKQITPIYRERVSYIHTVWICMVYEHTVTHMHSQNFTNGGDCFNGWWIFR